MKCIPLVLLIASSLLAANTKPNVVLLISDDQGWMDVGYHGGEPSTANIDQFRKSSHEISEKDSY
ncbi:MAG: hypothetical protein CMI18_06600 [Opitutaceae bacterium]|nr:hypothetical protein [Opitutaceae bacterium]|tara:strand:- start:5710 stop:5904 length:195 start_codon:yes stop_codon:yes gene_type:complete